MRRFNLFCLRHRHLWPLLFAFIYMPWFISLENIYDSIDKVSLVHCRLDDIIPFCEAFIIPYMIWFLYIPIIFITLYFSSNKEFYRLCAYEFIGMLITLVIYTLWPNGHDLRIDINERDNLFMTILSFVYTNDTSTNVCPSIHVYATVAAHICLIKSPQAKVRPYIKPISTVLAVLICASTFMLKQHSIIDSLCGLIFAYVMYLVIFKWWFKNLDIPDINHDKHQVLFWLNK